MSDFPNLIAGEECEAASGKRFERRNPADAGDLIGRFPASELEDAHRATAAVAEGMAEWAARSPEARMTVLERTADLLLENADSLARELTREEGKTLAESTNEVKRTAANFRLYAGEALRVRGETFPVGEGQLVCTLRAPVGVVAAITPWNFPTSIPARKIGPALAAGNGVVFKPSEYTPLLGHRLVELLLAAGLPAGAIALLHGSGADLGDSLVTAREVAAVTFTGSHAAGCRIHMWAGPDRRLQLEMGGKNPCIILPDADPDVAEQAIVRGAFGLSGQACTATSRAIVVGDLYETLVDRVAARAESMVVGNGLDDGVQMGPLANQAQLDKVLRYVETGREDGARLVAGGSRLTGAGRDAGYFVSPAVFTDVPADARIARDEIFGPVVGFQRAGSLDEALAMANTVSYGLAAAIVTRDVRSALAFAEGIEAGVVKINSPTTGVALTAPFGGIKQSSNQTYKEQAGHGVMDFYTTTKTVYLAG